MKFKKTLFTTLLLTLVTTNVYSQSIRNNTYDEGSSNGTIKKYHNKKFIVDAKLMTPNKLAEYSGAGTYGYVDEYNNFRVRIGNGYAFNASPFFKPYDSNSSYSIRVELELATNFDYSISDQPAVIHVLNNGEVIYTHKLQSLNYGSIEKNGKVNSFEKIVFHVDNISHVHNLVPKLFMNDQYDKVVSIKGMRYFLFKNINVEY